MRNANKVNNNVVTMVLDQAATGREVVGTVVTVVPDNKEFKVTAIDAEARALTLTEVLDEESDAVAETITLSEKNARIAHYVNNPNEKPVPEATLDDKNGKKVLVIEGNEISCGQLDVLKILDGVKGKVLLLVGSASNDEAVDLMSYEVQADKFETISSEFSLRDAEITAIRLADDVLLINDRLIVQKEEKDENGKVTGKYDSLAYNELYQVSENGYIQKCSDEYGPEFPIIEDAYVAKQADRRDLVIVSTKELDGDRIIDVKPELTLYRINRAGEVCELVGSYEVTDKKARVYLGGGTGSAPVITVKDQDKVLITTARGTLVVNEPEIVAALDGFNYFDGVYAYEDEDGNIGAQWYYSNKAREEVSFTSVDTDRGTLFELLTKDED